MSLFNYNLNKCGKEIDIADRKTTVFNGEPSEAFTVTNGKVRAIIKTVSGVSVFDDTNTERVVTHKIVIKFLPNFTSEKWILFKNKKIKILTVENYLENDECLILMCTERGLDSKVVNNA